MGQHESGTVWVVEDDDALRASFVETLAARGLQVEGFASGRAFLEAFDAARPGCVVLDVRLPELGGLDVQRALVRRGCGVDIVFVTGVSDVATAVEAMRLGAFDFLEKPFAPDVLVERVTAALSRNRTEFERTRRGREARERLATLTSRERQVLDLVANGRSNRQVAEQLGISQRTVEVHRSHLMTKMKADNLVALLAAFRAAAED